MEKCQNCRVEAGNGIGEGRCPLHETKSSYQNLESGPTQDIFRGIRAKETTALDLSGSFQSPSSRPQIQPAVLSTPIKEEDRICWKCRRPGQFLLPADIQIYCASCVPRDKGAAWDLSHSTSERLPGLIKSAVFEAFQPTARLHTIGENQFQYAETRSIGELLQIAQSALIAKAENPEKSPCFRCLSFLDEQGRCLCNRPSPKKAFKVVLKSSVLIGGRIFDVDFFEKRFQQTYDSGNVFQVRETVVLKCSHPVSLCEVWIGATRENDTIMEGQVDGAEEKLMRDNIVFSLNPQLRLREEMEIELAVTATVRTNLPAGALNPYPRSPCIGEDGSIWYSWTKNADPILGVFRAKYKLN